MSLVMASERRLPPFREIASLSGTGTGGTAARGGSGGAGDVIVDIGEGGTKADLASDGGINAAFVNAAGVITAQQPSTANTTTPSPPALVNNVSRPIPLQPSPSRRQQQRQQLLPQHQQYQAPLSVAAAGRSLPGQQPQEPPSLLTKKNIETSGAANAVKNVFVEAVPGMGGNLRRPRDVEKLPIDSYIGQEGPSDAYLGERYFQNPVPSQGFSAPPPPQPPPPQQQKQQQQQQQQNASSRALTGNGQAWMVSPTLGELNPNLSSLTSSGRGGSGANGGIGNIAGLGVASAGVVTSNPAGVGSGLGNAGVTSVQWNMPARTSSSLGLGGNVTAGTPPGWSQDWAIVADEVGNAAASTGVGGNVGTGMGANGSATNATAVAAAAAAAEGSPNIGGSGFVGITGAAGSVRVAGATDVRVGKGAIGATGPTQNDLSILNTLSAAAAAASDSQQDVGIGPAYGQGAGAGVVSQGLGLGGGLGREGLGLGGPGQISTANSMNYKASASLGLLNERQQQIRYNQQQQRLLQPFQRSQQMGLSLADTPGLMQGGLPVGMQTRMQTGAQAGLQTEASSGLIVGPEAAIQRVMQVHRRSRGGSRGSQGKRQLADDEIEVQMSTGERRVLQSGPDGKYPCPECSKRLVNSSTLQNHIRSVHQNAGTHICPYCPPTQRRFMWKSTLDIHIRHVHKKERPYKCEFEGCSQGFRWQSHLKEHVIVAHELRRDYECPVCIKTFGRKNNWQKHLRNVHKIKDIGLYYANQEAQHATQRSRDAGEAVTVHGQSHHFPSVSRSARQDIFIQPQQLQRRETKRQRNQGLSEPNLQLQSRSQQPRKRSRRD